MKDQKASSPSSNPGGKRAFPQQVNGAALAVGRTLNAPGRPKRMHARGETVDALPTFVESFAERRGILLTYTFKEREKLPNGKNKQWVIMPKNMKPIPFVVGNNGIEKAGKVTASALTAESARAAAGGYAVLTHCE